jgi:hypothetical protein
MAVHPCQFVNRFASAIILLGDRLERSDLR